jgi:hypothetical protein
VLDCEKNEKQESSSQLLLKKKSVIESNNNNFQRKNEKIDKVELINCISKVNENFEINLFVEFYNSPKYALLSAKFLMLVKLSPTNGIINDSEKIKYLIGFLIFSISLAKSLLVHIGFFKDL